MSTAAQLAANIANAQASSGPTTDEGKANSCKNALTNGLYASRDFIRPGEEEAYATLDEALEANLAPNGPVEQNLMVEIRRAMWRLNRCGEVEATLVSQFTNGSDPASGPIEDPMQNEATARLQNSVDRARAQAHRLLHKCTSELRRLQTERQYKNQIFPEGTDLSEFGLADWRSINKSLAERARGDLRRRKLDGLDDFESLLEATQKQMAGELNIPAETPLTKGTQSAVYERAPESTGIARNAPCPCNSGEKYKRCCGRNAPAILQAA